MEKNYSSALLKCEEPFTSHEKINTEKWQEKRWKWRLWICNLRLVATMQFLEAEALIRDQNLTGSWAKSPRKYDGETQEFNLEKQWEFASAASHLARRSLASCALVMPRLVQHSQSSSKPHQKQGAGAVQSGHPLEVAAVSRHRRALPLQQDTRYHRDLPAHCNGQDPLARNCSLRPGSICW